VVSDGVKVKNGQAGPAFGAVLGEVNAKEPDTVAEPPESVAPDNVWPYVMAEAEGTPLTVGVALLTVTFTDIPETVL